MLGFGLDVELPSEVLEFGHSDVLELGHSVVLLLGSELVPEFLLSGALDVPLEVQFGLVYVLDISDPDSLDWVRDISDRADEVRAVSTPRSRTDSSLERAGPGPLSGGLFF